jgi:hypothetical protein
VRARRGAERARRRVKRMMVVFGLVDEERGRGKREREAS